jgi:hypothetical protein
MINPDRQKPEYPTSKQALRYYCIRMACEETTVLLLIVRSIGHVRFTLLRSCHVAQSNMSIIL